MRTVYSLALAATTTYAQNLECFNCDVSFNSQPGSNAAGPSCWTPAATASGDADATAQVTAQRRCFTDIYFTDGYPTRIHRYGSAAEDDANNISYGAQTCGEASGTSINNFRTLFYAQDNLNAIQIETKCQMDCATDDCNTHLGLGGTSGYNVCPQIADHTQKWCDFTDQTWKCNNGFYPDGNAGNTGNPASNTPCQVSTATVTDTFTPISCVQCNSMTDTDCWSKSTATQCNDETYTSCFSTSAVTYDRHTGAVLLETLVKGCSTVAAAGGVVHDQCYWSDAETTLTSGSNGNGYDTEKDTETANYDHGYELTCTQRCDPSGSYCNGADVPNGVVDDNVVYCAQYDSDTAAGAIMQTLPTVAEACPSGTTGCYSKVSYMLRAKNDLKISAWDNDFNTDNTERVRITSHKRGCATASTVVTGKCESNTFTSGSNFQPQVTMHTCESQCTGNFCNYDWPNRVKCLRTDDTSTYEQNKYGNWVVHPCPTPADDTCYVAQYNFLSPTSKYYRDQAASDAYIQNGDDLGFSTSISRGCIIQDDGYFETGCRKNGHRGDDMYFESCNMTCTNDGCNFGTGYSSSFLKMTSPLVVMVAYLFGRL